MPRHFIGLLILLAVSTYGCAGTQNSDHDGLSDYDEIHVYGTD